MINIFEKSFTIRQPRDTNLIRWEAKAGTMLYGFIKDELVFKIIMQLYGQDIVGFHLNVMRGADVLEQKYRKIHKFVNLNRMCETIYLFRYENLCNEYDVAFLFKML